MNETTAHPAFLADEQLLQQCHVRRQRRSGPGGQHRNKVETAVVLSHLPTGIQGEASERRSQHENLQVAIFRLRLNLAVNYRTHAESSCPLWRQRTSTGRIAINATHDDFPAVLAHALNVLAENNMNLPIASTQLAVSSSQLLRLLKKAPAAFEQLNRWRKQEGLPALK